MLRWPEVVAFRRLWSPAELRPIGGLAAVPDITRGSYLFFLKPVIAAVLAVAFLSQQLTGWQIVAILVICSSVAVEALWARFKPS